ncbi:trypsin-like serine protease [Pirellulaceae bacterium SH449]
MQQNTAKETSGQSTSKTHGESPALPSHLSDDMLNASLPTRTWGEFIGETSRKLGLGSALLGAGLGLSGIAPSGMEKRAEGGIIISGGDDQQARERGETFSVFGGGNTGFLKRVTDLGTFHSSMVFINDRLAVAAAHSFRNEFGNIQDIFVGTSPNFNQPELGSLTRVSEVIFHPSYNGTAAGGSIDLAILKFESPVAGVKDVVFAEGRPTQNQTVWFSGYGVTGNPTDGYLGQDGFIRAGTSRAQEGTPLLGGNPDLYMNALFTDRSNFPNDLRLAPGDSGGGTWNGNGELWGINIGASTSVTSRGSMFLSTSAPEVRNFIDLYSSTAVPEPSSLALAVTALGLGGWLARRRNFLQRISLNKQKNGYIE